jgi:phosphoribosyl-AMP cyclohydrolase
MSFDPSSLKYNDAGLIPAIAQDATSGEVLMMAWMNSAAVEKTLETRRVTYWSRSRQAFWIKGETSGHTQELVSFSIDCDRDCLLVTVNQIGAACHTGRRTCFYTDVVDGVETVTQAPLEG